MTRHLSDERGSGSVELVLLTPAIVLLLLLVVLGGRYAQARADVDAAARDAARAASFARGADSARSSGLAAAGARLDEGSVTCRTLNVEVDTSNFRAGGDVVATVTCTVGLGDLTGLRMPTSRTFTARFAEPVDTYRGTSS